jgi:hypothetical protein
MTCNVRGIILCTVENQLSPKGLISITAGHRPADQSSTLRRYLKRKFDAVKGRTLSVDNSPAFQAVDQGTHPFRGSSTRGYENPAFQAI